MSREFIILASMTAVNLIFNIVILILFATRNKKRNAGNQAPLPGRVSAADGVGVVFCRNCGNQFDSGNPVCPQCQLPR
jgi:uncharacterized protein (DUF2147 family)